MNEILHKLHETHSLTKEEYVALITCDPETEQELKDLALQTRIANYGKEIYIRGLIELTNYCKNDCLYCGIRRSNKNCNRYRLSSEDVLSCCEEGYGLGFRTFVLQGGEDPYFNDDRICEIVSHIRQRYPDCAITLSIGEKSKASYQRFFDSGANRYLLRHETANAAHYQKLHPKELTLEHRMRCLHDLQEIGYQVGCGFMVGSPYQTVENLAEDLRFIEQFSPQMIGIGPFIPHHETPFAAQPAGSVELVIRLLAILRVMIPTVLLPATTALATLDPHGREKGILAGANVVMPNLSPVSVREKYLLYDNKACTGEESAQYLNSLSKQMAAIGCTIAVDRGDSKNVNNQK